MRILQSDISASLSVSKLVRLHSFSVENTLLRQHPVGPGSKSKEEPVWRGDHTFNSDAASFSLLNFIEPEIEAANPHLSKTEVQNLALEKFEVRLKQDLAFEKKENSHVDTTVHWTVVDGKDGKKELATKYGQELVTLSQLWDHTRTYAEHIGNPLAYNKEEERAQLRMQDALIEGKANGFVSVISHPDAIRYVQIWERTSAGEIASKQIDLYATTGRDFTHTEGQALVQSITKYHEGHGTSTTYEDVTYAHALFTSGNTNVDDVRTIAVAHAFSDMRKTTVDVMTQVAIHTARDIQETTILLGKDFHAYVQKKIDDFKKTTVEVTHVRKDVLPDEAVSVSKEESTSHKASIGGDNQTKDIDTSEHHEFMIHDVLSEWVFNHKALSLGMTHEVFAHSALTFLMVEPSVHNVTQEIFSSIGEDSHEVKTTDDADVRKTVESVLIFLQKIFGDVSIKKESHKTMGERDSHIDSLVRLFLGEDIDQSVSPIESGLHVIMQALSFLAHEAGYNTKSIHEDKTHQIDTSIKDAMGDILKDEVIVTASRRAIFGIVIWMILQGFDRTRDSSTHGDALFVGKKNEMLSQGESQEFFSTTPWILLSIIWHLSMAREAQSSHYTPPSIKTKKQKIIVSTCFPLSGIVYLYVRDRISIDTSNVPQL